MYDISISKSFCKKCGLCVIECPSKTAGKEDSHVDPSNEFCDKCLHCFAICPNEAIFIEDGENYLPAITNPVDSGALLSLFKKRRSYRRFKKDPIPERELNRLMEAVRYIPSGGNSHEVDVTILQNNGTRKNLLEAIKKYYRTITGLAENPVLKLLLSLFGDKKIKEAIQDEKYSKKIMNIIHRMEGDGDPVFYNAPAVLFFHSSKIIPTAKEDCIIAAYNTALYGESMGLGSCFVSLSQQALADNKKCRDIISLEDNHQVHAVLIIGYPISKYKKIAARQKKRVRII